MIGSVCYIDLLGFSDLTKNPEMKNRQKIILRYIKNLHKYIKQATENTRIRYCILSDSAFLYVENDVNSLLFAVARIFRNCICAGVLLRAGLAYGEYNFIETAIETNNIFGVAVTKAVAFEKKGKGCRVFTDNDLPAESNLMDFNPNVFKAYKNHSDYSEIDVFEWPLFYQDYYTNIKDDNNDRTKRGLKNLLFSNCKILSYLEHSPLFLWNSKSEAGRVHLLATIEYITNITNELIEVSGLFKNKENIEENKMPTYYSFDVKTYKQIAVDNLVKRYQKIYEML